MSHMEQGARPAGRVVAGRTDARLRANTQRRFWSSSSTAAPMWWAVKRSCAASDCVSHIWPVGPEQVTAAHSPASHLHSQVAGKGHLKAEEGPGAGLRGAGRTATRQDVRDAEDRRRGPNAFERATPESDYHATVDNMVSGAVLLGLHDHDRQPVLTRATLPANKASASNPVRQEHHPAAGDPQRC